MRKPLYLALAALLGTAGIGHAADDTVRVRLDASDTIATEALGISPLQSTDYGNFRILELSRSDANKLLARSSAASVIADAGRIRFNDVNFDPIREGQQARKGAFPTTADGAGLHLVQFIGPAKQAWREAIEQQGLRVLQYYPNDTFLVWGRMDSVAETARQPFVRWQGGFLADYKINRDLHGRTGLIGNVDVHFYNDGNVKGLIDKLKGLGAHVITHAPAQPDKAFFDAWIKVDASQLEKIAQLPQVVWMGYASPTIQFDDEMSNQIIAGNYNGANAPQLGYAPWLTTFAYNGTGVIWAVTDTGSDLGHPDLAPRIVGGFSMPGCAAPNGDDEQGGGHGTHVAGIIAGVGLGDGTGPGAEADAAGFLYGLGVAPGTSLYPICTGENWPPLNGWQELSKLGLAGNAIGTNASWTTGEGTAHGYQASERTFDMMIRDGDFDAANNQPYIIAFSAGNSGPGASTLTAPKEAKNPIIVASSTNFRAGAINAISGFSSRGPAVDGRVLPNVSAPGESIASARRRAGASLCGTEIAGTATHYALCSGTSMAAPHVSGSIALITQWWRAQHAGATPSPAMAKALLVNGAIDMATADVPNNNEGWGRVNLANTIDATMQQFTVDQSIVLDDAGQNQQWTVGVANPSKPVRITLAWTDAPGAVGANPALVNNLDLEVSHAGNTYKGNVMTAGVSSTGGTADAKNNVENVFLPAGAGGAVTIRVNATNLPGDGIPGSGDATDQDFALVCDNCAVTPMFGLQATPSSREICAPSDASFTLDVSSVLGYSDPVELTTANVPAGATATVTPTTVTPGNTATATLTGTGSLAAGAYTFNVNATSTSGPQTQSLDVQLYTAPPAAGVLVAPTNNQLGVTLKPTLQWNAVPQAKTYFVQIAKDAAFTDIVASETVSGTQLTLGTALLPNTAYHWRVRADNTCGAGTQSPVSTFTTANLICVTPNLAVPDNNATGVNSDLVVADAGTLTDLDVSLKMSHTWPGDVTVSLTHVASNTTVILGNRMGGTGCSVPDVDVRWNDGAASAMSCRASSPGIGGDVRASNPLAPFNARELAGTWRLNVADLANQDTGVVQEWCLSPVATAPVDAIFKNGFESTP
ncbi:S8 family serine peptidase [Tahibacter amnicola]|uniref:S8 family serine peptidase n=1 Tax=Tahibacter amnicola TaxID=2976241 RepID=A0ABY6BJ11_9GAMM|nr:S8 family serine peptidase [Tahibacter amnicola]UXI69996.1 S8 family serine peptidase [Tahibacter amnicola]